jgi:integrase
VDGKRVTSLLGQFFRYARKQGWTKGDPFAKGADAEVKIPREQDSDAMRVLSLEEQLRYLRTAANEIIDLADVATIMILQGPRPEEVMSLEQSHVDLRNRHFTIWDDSAEGKSKIAHRKLKMTEESFRIFARRLSTPGVWVFPSSKNDGPRTTLLKAHVRATRGKKNKRGEYEGGSGIVCRLYDMRHTFATRFALAGGSLPVLAKILGHADLRLLMRYVHPAQADMDRAMEWYASMQTPGLELERMLIEYEDGKASLGGWPRPSFGPTTSQKLALIGPTQPNLRNRRIS